MDSEPHCLWTTGVIANNYTTLPDTEQMMAEDTEENGAETIQKVYIDGSATTIGASAYAGWGM
eukprot:6817671-Heterocapsa_arctica.AAC.1